MKHAKIYFSNAIKALQISGHFRTLLCWFYPYKVDLKII